MSDDVIIKAKELVTLKEAFKKQVTAELRGVIPQKKEELKKLIDEL